MTKVRYKIVEHDGGWAYKVGAVFSEAFPSHDDAHRAAENVLPVVASPSGETNVTGPIGINRIDA